MKAVSLLSGGLDSVTLAYDLASQGYELNLLSFDYGQRHGKELYYATIIAERLSSKHHVIKLGVESPAGDATFPLGVVLGGSVLVDPSTTVPDGHYADQNMKQTVVPNRNAIMLGIAYGVALAEKADLVAFAAHAGDHAIYPDCRPEFVDALEHAFKLGASWDDSTFGSVPDLRGPYLLKTKADIVLRAAELSVPFQLTWSCYKGNDVHCGTCGTCYERREAFELAGIEDPTVYADSVTRFDPPKQDVRVNAGLATGFGVADPDYTKERRERPN